MTGWCMPSSPSAVRPKDYPADLPFLADQTATMVSVRGSTTLEWDGAPPRVAEVLARTLANEGWVETTLPDSSMPGMRIRPFRMGGRQRVLIYDGRLLSLLDTRAE